MNVIRDIDIKDLKEVFKRQIDLAVKKELANVRINYVTALRILDVLEETQIREEKHQTLESACTFIEMEDGTQTNEMELHNKTDANGNVLRGAKAYEKITKMVANFQKEHGVIPKCFGTYEYDKNLDKCFKCEYIKECAKSSDAVIDCFGWHINGDKKCNLCAYKRECMIEKKEREKCFGKSYGKRPIIICGTCKYRERCEVLTKHEQT